jgi:type I restriction enzyme S subunit
MLGCLDDRIDLLRQTNTSLEAIAQTLFKSWLVDFDPVHAKEEGRGPEAMDAATATLFPCEFEASELGLIPRGWRVKRLSDLAELAYGKALKASDRVRGEIPVYGSGGITGWHDAALVNEPTIIVGRKGSVGTIYWEDRPCHPIDTVFFVRQKAVPLSLCLQVLRSLGLDNMNTDAAVPGLNRENAYRLQVVVAPAAVNDAWQKIAEPTYASMSNNNRRVEVLTQLRDTLLPRLISGKLRLPEAEAAIESALDA